MQLSNLNLSLTRVGRAGGAIPSHLLKEDSDALLLENGGFISLE